MGEQSFHDGRVALHAGDCIDVIKTLADNSVDAVVTDPPYHLVSIVNRFGADDAAPAISSAQRRFAKTGGADRKPGPDQYGRLSRGFMGQAWDGGDIAFRPETWAEVLRVLKPGGHLVAFAAPKNQHRLICAIEDAGFEIRDCLAWLFGVGFPKSHDVSKGIDRINGAQRKVIAAGAPVKRMIPGADQNREGWEKTNGRVFVPTITEPASDEFKDWEGWGTALKPAWEPICLARKPLSEKSVAANVLRWGTGAINIDATRVQGGGPSSPRGSSKLDTDANEGWMRPWMEDRTEVARREAAAMGRLETLGRWPANIVLSWPEDEYALRRDVTPEQKRELYRWLSENS